MTVDTHDRLNRLLTKSPGGPLLFKGTLNEPGRVTINGVPATVSAVNAFQASIPVTVGTNTVTINAVDASGNAAEAVYEVDQAGTGKTFTYDANGNMTSDGTRTFEWDGRNQLVAVSVGGRRPRRGLVRGIGRVDDSAGAACWLGTSWRGSFHNASDRLLINVECGAALHLGCGTRGAAVGVVSTIAQL